MNIRNWVKFYLKTLIIAGIATVIIGFAIEWDKYKSIFVAMDVLEIGLVALWLVGIGFIFGTLSQMGYFAYLTVHRIGLGLFRSLWNAVQLVITAFVLFDLVYLRYNAFAQDGDSVLPYILVALLILLISLVISYLKSQQSTKDTFVPALFFMVVVTTLEWVPVLRANEESWLHLMLYPLLICNAYQLLALPKYIEQSQKERLALKAKKELVVK
ncbi:KinB-signaling pathway activation protein [Caldibacillus lycopersici]|uniref:KinB-signaling pathway activation protein n=1 Tax=Perspicuibacillus lycopersici TaxID=1325689 RepID=A0AAE3LU39_9BACI|nr:KinB-signaling pathway activation protein [Perspicuibacillus lycopersici]MCU9615178.1 KinB-signaling pathway activation protein [Perspicuibacillus lycopersici]